MTGPGPRYRVLLVDDTVPLRSLFAQALEADSRLAVVGEAGDGARGVALALDLQPDAIVLDLAMPEMDGIEALPRLRAVAPHARIVVLSGFRRAPFAAGLLRGGAVGYLEKGLGPKEFRRELLAVLGALEAIEPVVTSARTVLPASPTSSGAARRFVSSFLGERTGPTWDDVHLMVSELVTNAVTHAHSSPQVIVQVHGTTLRVEVHDESMVLPGIRRADDAEPGGRGLKIVDRLASEWGIERRPGGKAIWFHVPLVDSLPVSEP